MNNTEMKNNESVKTDAYFSIALFKRISEEFNRDIACDVLSVNGNYETAVELFAEAQAAEIADLKKQIES